MKTSYSRVNFDKRIRIDKICSDNGFYKAMNFISFENGKMSATNGFIAVVLDIEECSTFSDLEIGLMNGHFLHKDDYADLIKSNFVTPYAEGFSIVREGREKIIKYATNVKKFPNCEKVFPASSKEISEIGIDLQNLSVIKGALPFKNTKFTFLSHAKPITLTDAGCKYTSKGLIMPVILTDLNK